MAEMDRYCRAYLVKEFRAFADWREDRSALAPDGSLDGGEAARPRTDLEDDDVLYLHEDLHVTDGIFKDEHVIFADVTEDWKTFCREMLRFQIPHWESTYVPGSDGPAAAAPGSVDGTRES